MSRSRAKNVIYEHLAAGWTACPLVPEGLRERFDPDDPEACPLFSPEGTAFEPSHVRGTVDQPGTGYVVVGFDEGPTEEAFQGHHGWQIMPLFLVVDHYTPALHGEATAETYDAALSERFHGWGLRDAETGALIKEDGPHERRFITFDDEDGWHRHQSRLPFELKINAAQESTP